MDISSDRNFRANVLIGLLLSPLLAGGAETLPSRDSPTAVAAPPALPDEQLDEVEATGERKVRNPQILIAWLRRLLGRFSYEGYVELRGEGESALRQPVRGSGNCVGFGSAPGVYCTIQVAWPEVKGIDGAAVPGGISSLVPATILYGLDPDFVGIRYLEVDSKGMANAGHGYVRGNTLQTTTPCVDRPGNCQRVARINAHPDGKLVETQIDIQVDARRQFRFMFVQRRIP